MSTSGGSGRRNFDDCWSYRHIDSHGTPSPSPSSRVNPHCCR
jgi:hypothetical protein